LRLVLHRGFPDDSALRHQWNDLVFRMEAPQVFYTYEWALAVSRAYRNSLSPLIWIGYEGDRVAGIAAFAESIERPAEAFFLAGATADYCDFICAPADASIFCQAVLRDWKEHSFTRITFANIPKDSPSVAVLLAQSGNFGYRSYSRTAYHCAQIVLGEKGQREQIRNNVEKRQAVRRQMASMSKIGAVRAFHDRSSATVADTLPELFRSHVARFLSQGRTSNLVSRERRAFLHELTNLLSEKQWLVNSRLMVGDQSVAFNFGFSFAGTWFWYQPTFQQRMIKKSPGLCLLSKIVSAACETPDINVVDLGLGAEEYKARFANASRETLHLTLHGSAIAHFKEGLRHQAVRAVKKSAALESALRHQRARIARVKQKAFFPLCKRVMDVFWQRAFSADEVLFYRWKSCAGLGPEAFRLKPIEIEDLADAAMRYCDDAETQAYLLRAARRIQSPEEKGYILFTPGQVPVHFCWMTRFEGFRMNELRHVLASDKPGSQLIFDCWTPGPERGKGHYPRAISMLAADVAAGGSMAWIFSAGENKSSRRGIVEAGFELQYSLIRKRSFFKCRLIRASADTASSAPERAVFAA